MLCLSSFSCLQPAEAVDIIDGAASVAAAILISWAAWVGRTTLKSFKNQKALERKIHHAEKIIFAVYNVVGVLKRARTVISTFDDIVSGDEDLKKIYFENGAPGRERAKFVAQSLRSTFEKEQGKYNDLITCIPFSKAIFGDAMKDSLENIAESYNAIEVLSKLIGESEYATANGNQWMQKAFERLDTEGEKYGTLNNIIKTIEEECFSVIRIDKNKGDL